MFSPVKKTKFIYALLLTSGLLFGCASGETGGTGGSVTLQSQEFPEIAEMTAKVSAYLELAGKTCDLAINPDTTLLSGQCPDIPTGVHSYTLKYIHKDTGLPLAIAGGSLTLESGEKSEISFPQLNKDLDNDSDGYTNLGEVMFSTNPKDNLSYPFEPAAFYDVYDVYGAGTGPRDMALGDLNKDGILDVVTANWDSDSVSVLLGKNDWTLQAAQVYTMGPDAKGSRNPGDVALGDLNGDTYLDVVVINSGANSDYEGDLAMLLNNGDGTGTLQQPAVFYTVGRYPISLALGDLNGDDRLDAVTANYESEDISVLLGKGDGTLQPYSLYNAGKVNSVDLGDIDSDSRLDLIASTFSSQSVAVLRGNGDGTFLLSKTYGIGIVNSLLLGDLNKDSILDLITSNYSLSKVTVQLGTGQLGSEVGPFKSLVPNEAGNNPDALAVGDLDKDGKADIVTVNAGSGALAVLLGKGDDRFLGATFVKIGNNLSSIALGDINGDGKVDVFVTDYDSGKVAVLINR